MFQLMLTIISYGSLLLLLMGATICDIVSTAVMFMLGAGLIVYKKMHKGILRNSKRYSLIPVAVFLVAAFGLVFYHRWLPSFTMQAIAALLHMSIETMLLIGSFVLAVLAFHFTYGILQTIAEAHIDSSPQDSFKRIFVSSLAASIITVFITQEMIGVGVMSMGPLELMWGVLIVSVVILFLFCLIGRIIPSIAIGAGLFIFISSVNVYVYQFRGRLFEPADIFSASTAMNVARNYRLFPIPPHIIIGWGIFCRYADSYLSLAAQSQIRTYSKKADSTFDGLCRQLRCGLLICI